jgi:hypothetical protein
VGQDEDAEPLVRRANFCRTEQARRRRVAQTAKLSQDGFKAEGNVTGNVFEENPFGGAFGDDSGDLGPEVAGVVGPAALASRAEGLTGISGEHDVEGTVKVPSIEAAEIIPDWRWSEISCALGCDEDGARPVLPFDKGAGVIS